MIKENISKDRDYWNYMYGSKTQMRYPSEVVIRFLKSNYLSGGGGRRLLDLGCGNGINAFMAFDLGFNVYLVDYSDVAINKIKKNNTLIPENQIICMDILDDLSIEDDFDVVISTSTLYHFTKSQLEIILYKICDKLKVGGMVLCNFLPKDNTLFFTPKEKIDNNTFLIRNESWMTHTKKKKKSEITCSFFDDYELREMFQKFFKKIKIVREEVPMAMSLENDEEKTYSVLWVSAMK